MDIQDEKFDFVNKVEPNSMEIEYAPYEGADFTRNNIIEEVYFLELYQGKNMIQITKEDVLKMLDHFNSI